MANVATSATLVSKGFTTLHGTNTSINALWHLINENKLEHLHSYDVDSKINLNCEIILTNCQHATLQVSRHLSGYAVLNVPATHVLVFIKHCTNTQIHTASVIQMTRYRKYKETNKCDYLRLEPWALCFGHLDFKTCNSVSRRKTFSSRTLTASSYYFRKKQS